MNELEDFDGTNEPISEQSEADNEYLDENALPLCPNCLTPCDPRTYFCQNCKSIEAINPNATYLPYVRILFAAGLIGKAWRKHLSKDNKSFFDWILSSLFIILLMLLYAPIVLLIAFPFILFDVLKKKRLNRDGHSLSE